MIVDEGTTVGIDRVPASLADPAEAGQVQGIDQEDIDAGLLADPALAPATHLEAPEEITEIKTVKKKKIKFYL